MSGATRKREVAAAARPGQTRKKDTQAESENML